MMKPFSHISVIGIPFDEYSSFLRGPAKAPEFIRAAYHSPSSNTSTEGLLDLSTENRWSFVGDIAFGTSEHPFENIKKAIRSRLKEGNRIVSLGGDHSITFPVIEAFGDFVPKMNILHIDAHADLYHEFAGNPLSHASPFARIMETGLIGRLVQVGIRTLTPHQKEQAIKFEVETRTMEGGIGEIDFATDEPLYLSIDLDGIDPAFAPGVSHLEPGGLSTREVINVIQSLNAPIIGADIVELNPDRDVNGLTAMVAAKLLKEILGKMLPKENRILDNS